MSEITVQNLHIICDGLTESTGHENEEPNGRAWKCRPLNWRIWNCRTWKCKTNIV